MNPRGWLAVAFIFTMIMGICALWAADMQTKRQAAASSFAASKAYLTPFERHRRAAEEKLAALRNGTNKPSAGGPEGDHRP